MHGYLTIYISVLFRKQKSNNTLADTAKEDI